MQPHICLFCLSERVWKREGNLKQNSVSNWIKLFLVTKYDYMTMNCNKKSTIDNLYGQGMWHAWNVFNSLLSPWSLHDRDAWSTWSRVSCTVKQFSNVTRCKLYSFCAVDQAICTITLKNIHSHVEPHRKPLLLLLEGLSTHTNEDARPDLRMRLNIRLRPQRVLTKSQPSRTFSR